MSVADSSLSPAPQLPSTTAGPAKPMTFFERVVDNFAFAGEVLFDWLRLGENEYTEMIKEAKKMRKEQREKERRLREEAAQLETQEMEKMEASPSQQGM
jgi:hypothetical protein